MKMEWGIDEKADGIDILGFIKMSDDSGNEIEINYTYLDSWFESLLSGFEKLHTDPCIRVDIVEEPHPVLLKMVDGGLQICYRNRIITIESLKNAEIALRRETNGFLKKAALLPGSEKNEVLDQIRGYLSNVAE
jgi:hypothetical protein